MTFAGLNPPVQPLMPNTGVTMRMKIGVQNGTAKSMQCWFAMFTLPGSPNADQSKRAMAKFRELIASSDQPIARDQPTNGGCYRDESVTLDKQNIAELFSRKGTASRAIYGMAYAKWKNEAGANFDTGLICQWMEPPQEMLKGTTLLVNPAWHSCAG